MAALKLLCACVALWAMCALSLSGCASAGAPRAPLTVVRCLPLEAYTPEQEKAVADELRAIPPGSALAGMIVDYGALRAADRACMAGGN